MDFYSLSLSVNLGSRVGREKQERFTFICISYLSPSPGELEARFTFVVLWTNVCSSLNETPPFIPNHSQQNQNTC